jgi:hypothetical protein
VYHGCGGKAEMLAIPEPIHAPDGYLPDLDEAHSIASLPLFRLLNLAELMERIDVTFLRHLMGTYGLGLSIPVIRNAVARTYAHFGETMPEGPISMPSMTEAELRDLAEKLLANGLPQSSALIRDWVGQRPGFGNLPGDIVWPELRRRVHSELEQVILLRVPAERADYFTGAQRFGEVAERAFPSAAYDIEEAAKCFSLARYTACVMHLMRALEVGIDALKERMGIDSHSPTWDAALRKISDAVSGKPEKDKDSDERARDEFIREAAHFFATVKIAVRNPAMHEVAKVYTDETAQEVYLSVRAFMRHLATKLSE